MNAPRPSLFARVNWLTAAIGLSLVTTIALIVLLVHAMRWSAFDDPLRPITILPGPNQIVVISVLDLDKVSYNGVELTLEELVHRVREENWKEHIQVIFVTYSQTNSLVTEPVVNALRKQGRQRIFVRKGGSGPPTNAPETGLLDKR